MPKPLLAILLLAIACAPRETPAPRDSHELTGAPLFVSSERAGTISVIDTATNRVVRTIAVGARPRGLALKGDGTILYAALTDLPGRNGTIAAGRRGIAAIDVASGKVRAMYDGGTDPETVAASADGTRLYVSNEDSGTATILDTKTGSPVATLVVGIEPEGSIISPDGRLVYITAETSSTISVIDTRKNTVIATFLVGNRPRSAAFSGDSRTAWVTSEVAGELALVDVASSSVIDTIHLPPPAKPVGVVLSPDDATAYVANGHGNSVSVIDTKTRQVTATIPAGTRPWNLALSPDGTRLYTANGLSDDVSVIDVKSRQKIATIRVPGGPWGVVYGRPPLRGR
jgi:PQQ-dependent catabolism-associated beta-propeller protein